MVHSAVLAAQTVMGSSPGMNLHQCLWTHLQVCGSKRLGAMLTSTQSAGVAPEGESEDHTSEKAHKRDPPWL